MSVPFRAAKKNAAQAGTAKRQPESSLVLAVSLRWYEPGQVRRVCSQAARSRAATPNDAPARAGSRKMRRTLVRCKFLLPEITRPAGRVEAADDGMRSMAVQNDGLKASDSRAGRNPPPPMWRCA